MASLNPDQEEQQNNQQQAPTGGPTTVSGTAGASASGGQGAGVGGAAPTSPVSQNQAPQANTGYTDVSSYLDANKGGSAQLGQQVASNLKNDYNTVKGGIDSSAQGVQSLADKGYTHENSGLIQKAAADPVSLAASDGNASAVQAQLNDQYTGPNSWGDYGTQQGNVASAQQEGNLYNTAGGLNVLAQKVEGPTASQGVNQLDTLLLGGSPEAMGTVKAASDPFSTLTGYLDSQNQAVTGAIGTAQNNAATAKANANSALLGPNGATAQLNAQIDSQVKGLQQTASQRNASVKAALTGLNPSPADLHSLGLSQEQWNALSSAVKQASTGQTVSSADNKFSVTSGTTNIDPSQWLTQQDPSTAINRQNSATADQYARAQALQKLVGNDKFTTDLTDPSLAGTATTELNKFDNNGATTTAQTAAQAEHAAAQAYADALQQGADDEHARLAAQNAAKNAAAAIIGNTAVGSSLAAVNGISGAAQNVASQFSGDQIGKTLLQNIATGGLATPAKAVASGISSAVNTISHFFCFHPDTLIEMEDGTEMPICRIEVGDHTKGGKVWKTSRAIGMDFYMYHGILVTAKHAVKEHGKWVRIENAKAAVKCPPMTEVVCNLVTENHRIFANGTEFADEHETDQYESLNMDQSIELLNRESESC